MGVIREFYKKIGIQKLKLKLEKDRLVADEAEGHFKR